MKKLLAMVLVLGLASAVNAGITLVDNGDNTVDISLTAGSLQGYTMFLDVAGGAAGAPAAMEDFKLGGTTPINLVAPSAAADQGGHEWKYVGAGITATTFIVGPTSFISGIPITIDGSEATITLTIPAGGTFVDGQGVEMTQSIVIPEPITMSLVGLGGLVALRRRR